jgi:hypothetical protein
MRLTALTLKSTSPAVGAERTGSDLIRNWVLVNGALRALRSDQVGIAAIALPQVPYWIFVASDMSPWQLMWFASAPAG